MERSLMAVSMLVIGEPDIEKYFIGKNRTEKRHFLSLDEVPEVRKAKKKNMETMEQEYRSMGLDKSADAVKALMETENMMDDEELFRYYTYDESIMVEGNEAYMMVNPDGHISDIVESDAEKDVPLIGKDGSRGFDMKNSDIDWDATNSGSRKASYTRIWEMCMEGSKPADDKERKMKDIFSKRMYVIRQFDTKEGWVEYNTVLAPIIVLDEKGWHDIMSLKDLGENMNKEWRIGFMKRFIEGLGPDERIRLIKFTTPCLI